MPSSEQDGGGGDADAVAGQFAIVAAAAPAGGGERFQDRERTGRRRCPACRWRSRRRLAACGCARRLVPSSARPFAPHVGLLRGELLGRQVLSLGVVRIDPGFEVFGPQIGERAAGDWTRSPFGIDDDSGNAVDGGFFQQADAEAGLAAAGHADADGVGDQIFAVVEEQVVFVAPEIEGAQFFEILHVRQIGNSMPCASGSSPDQLMVTVCRRM